MTSIEPPKNPTHTNSPLPIVSTAPYTFTKRSDPVKRRIHAERHLTSLFGRVKNVGRMDHVQVRSSETIRKGERAGQRRIVRSMVVVARTGSP